MEKVREIELALSVPFPENDIEWRVQRAGLTRKGDIYAMVLAYVTNRAIMNRLDDVCGVFGWQNQYKDLSKGGYMCGISILNTTDNEWVTKWDGADQTKVEEVKGGISSAMKRAGSVWGIGRYLYKLPSTFATIVPNGKHNGVYKDKQKQNVYFKWNAPKLTKEFLP